MKTTLAILTSLLCSCATPEQNERLGQLVNLAISVAERRGVLSSKDAEDIRDAKTIVLPPATSAEPPASGK